MVDVQQEEMLESKELQRLSDIQDSEDKVSDDGPRYLQRPKLGSYSLKRGQNPNYRAIGDKVPLAKRLTMMNRSLFNVSLDESLGLSSLVDDSLVDALQLPEELHRFGSLKAHQREV